MINIARTEITGDQRSNPVRTLLLRNRHRLSYFEKSALDKWLGHHPMLKEIYWCKEALHQLYLTRGFKRASRAIINLTDRMALSKLPEILKLRKTLMKWRVEILHYFESGLTGDVIWTPANVKHWHGATPDSSMTHAAVTETMNGKAVEWMERVTDEQYKGYLNLGDSVSNPFRGSYLGSLNL